MHAERNLQPGSKTSRMMRLAAIALCQNRYFPGQAVKKTAGEMVGLVRFELTTSCTPCKRATRLRYSPN